MIQLYTYEAGTGDFIRIRFWNNTDNIFHNIFIDGGKKPKKTEKRYKTFQKVIEDIGDNESIDCVFVTHWDADHIEGVLEFIKNADEKNIEKIKHLCMNTGIVKTKEIAINGVTHSPTQAKNLVQYIQEKKIPWIDSISIEQQEIKKKDPLFEFSGAKLWIISPGNDQLDVLKAYNKNVAEAAEEFPHAGEIKIPKSLDVYCIIKIPKVAKQKWRKLHRHFGENCKVAMDNPFDCFPV